ncbi:hypothetical protein ABWW58_04680 [Sporolactobacillus sp. STCC-11]|uniref:hypothetical protein n=1 Tax=Sporolactobacillus caesalpiniae TaxID=3230362 RepID=UPI003391E7A9
MGSKLISKPKYRLKDECIRVPKVYDWVTDKIGTKVKLQFSKAQLEDIECALADPYRRPLRVVVKTPKTPPLFPLGDSEVKKGQHKDFFCEQVGEKQSVEGTLYGRKVYAQLVNILFTANVTVYVVDREGEEVAKLKTDVSAIEPFALCYPDGTDLLCRVTKISARVLDNTVILNGPFPSLIKLKVYFCADVQVEAEVKLSVQAKFCKSRGNDIQVIDPDWNDPCPEVKFPKECDNIFPRKHHSVSANGASSGHVTDESEYDGRAAIKVTIDSNDPDESSLTFKYKDLGDDKHDRDFTFEADQFDPSSIDTFEKNGYSILKIAGVGHADDKEVGFELDLAEGDGQDRFSLKLINKKSGKVTFATGLVEVDEGNIKIDLG